jgi:cytoskeleton protein RodZ
MQSDHLAPGTESAASPGVRLRRAREARGESVHEAAFAIKLSPRQIEALENDDFAALPGMAFVRGFARNYARYLGLDAAPLLDGIERLAGADQPDLSPIRNADGDLPSGGGTRRGSFPAGAVVAVLLVLLGVGWYFDWFRTEPPAALELQTEPAPAFAPAPTEAGSAASSSSEPVAAPALAPLAPAETSAPAVAPGNAAANSAVLGASVAGTMGTVPTDSGAPASTSPAAAPGAPASIAPPALASTSAAAPAEASPAAEEGVGGKRLSFRFGGDSWIEVRDASGTILHSGTNRAGSSRVVQGTPPFRLVVGNSANVVLEQDGQAVDLAAHTRGSVARLTLP